MGSLSCSVVYLSWEIEEKYIQNIQESPHSSSYLFEIINNTADCFLLKTSLQLLEYFIHKWLPDFFTHLAFN